MTVSARRVTATVTLLAIAMFGALGSCDEGDARPKHHHVLDPKPRKNFNPK